ncbi:putative transmembrane protein [Senna tora]|uniref:Putative transmembrane protein n=1 Tax=Senna tora TaxID=362788 RepID=A0A834T1B1_9FABA|nr:putative transmembrane protein [Senna tora]
MVANNNKIGEGASSSAILILCLFLWLCVSVLSVEVEEQQQKVVEEEQRKKKPWVSEWERLREAYGIYTKVWSASSWQWQMLKKIGNEAYYRWFPPNLDFRKHDETEGERGGAGEKVKEALAKSVGKSKATVEDSARSAAKMAGETVHKATEKVKKTFSDGQTHPQNEL